jgi:hypothetical protein
VEGFEPPLVVTKKRCLATWLHSTFLLYVEIIENR